MVGGTGQARPGAAPVSRTDPSQRAQYDKALGYLLGDIAVGVAWIGLEAGLFAALRAREPLLASALADDRDLDPDAVAVWCRSAYAFEWIDRDGGGRYRLAPHMQALLLDPDDPAYLGGRIRFAGLSHHDLAGFVRFLRSGRPVPRSEHNPELLEILADSSAADAPMLSGFVLPQASDAVVRLEAGGTLLEVGVGAGQHAIHYASQYPAARIVGLEFDGPSVELARANVAAAGLGQRIEIREADVNELDEATAYDVVTMNIVLHETGGPAEQRNVLVRVWQALKPGGVLVVSELPYPDVDTDYRRYPVYRRLAGLMLHEAQVGCASITQGELLLMVHESGFADVHTIEQPRESRFVVVGTRPR